MLANEAMELMKFKVTDYYRVGRFAIEYMTSEGDELATLVTPVGEIILNVNGDAQFEYDGKIFESEEDLDGREDVVKRLRKDDIYVENYPWYEVVMLDADNKFNDTDMMHIGQLPTTLHAKGMLMDELKSWVENSEMEEKMDDEMMKLRDTLPDFHTFTIKLNSNVRVDSIERIMTEFLIGDENLFAVLACVEMEAVKDSYGEKWFTISFYCPSEKSVRNIRMEIMKYGDIWQA